MKDEHRIDGIERVDGFIFADHTTYGLGGKANCAYIPKNERQACELIDRFLTEKIDFTILGNGSNILVSDSGFNGSVICTAGLNKIEESEGVIYCGAGVKVGKLLSFCKERGLSGLEYLAGIPATIGGIVYMNGGACGRTIGENVKSVTFYDGNLKNYTAKDCLFGNKHSTMRDIKCLILGVELNVYRESGDKIAEKIKNALAARARQPKGKSCGCVFKNYNGHSAGKIIDGCGLKGLREGGAVVSLEHANFIINESATSADVYKLISRVKKLVKERNGADLEEEVIYIGDFNDINC